MMSVNAVAQKLAQQLKGAKWLAAVGIGQKAGHNCIFLYVTKQPPKNLPELREAEGQFPIVIRRTKAIKPAQSRNVVND